MDISPAQLLNNAKERFALHDHFGAIHLLEELIASGRAFAGKLVQLITASTGLDDYEWGVTLFAVTPEVVKDVVYTLRYDEGSALYGDFGAFYVGYLADIDAFGAHRAQVVDVAALAGDEEYHGKGVVFGQAADVRLCPCGQFLLGLPVDEPQRPNRLGLTLRTRRPLFIRTPLRARAIPR